MRVKRIPTQLLSIPLKTSVAIAVQLLMLLFYYTIYRTQKIKAACNSNVF